MKNLIKYLFISLPLIFLIFCSKTSKNTTKILEQNFVTPPDSIQTSVYWYWVSDNISEEGVVKDLEAMKKVGINRAFIGNMGNTETARGKVRLMSDEWWKVLHAALKRATELNIEIGIFNSPGWSQSGGVWVKPDQAMRYLASSELRVQGPFSLDKKLDVPVEPFQDVKVIAYPEPKDDQLILNTKNASITSSPNVNGLPVLFDQDKNTGINFPEREDFILDFKSNKPFTARSISVTVAEQSMDKKAELQVQDENGGFHTISVFQINRGNTSVNCGFIPYAPVVISFPAVTATFFRLIIKDPEKYHKLAEVELATAPRVERYAGKSLAKMYSSPTPYWKEYQWRQQPEPDDNSLVIDASEVIDITKYLSEDGRLKWNVPEGKWVIRRMGMTPTGTKNGPSFPDDSGLEIDKMSKQHIREHFDAFIGEILKRIPEADRQTFKVVVMDSYERGGQDFTDDFLENFKERYGYDALPYLPVFDGYVVNSEKASDGFLWDVRRMVADKIAYDYVGGLREVSHENGLTTWLECYGHWGFPAEFLMYGGQSDEVAGEFGGGQIENRAASSCGHIYGKRKISAESTTCVNWAFSRYPAMFKKDCDRFFAEGINNTLLHVYISQAYEDKNPGVNAGYGNEFNRKNTWFSQLDVFVDYLKRTNYMLQQGLNVADAAYFVGEDAPKMTGITDPELPLGYQFDYVNAEVIEKKMTVKDGLLTLPHGTQYRILVLPPQETMRPELLQKIKQLVVDGAVVLGPIPKRSPSLQNQPEADLQIQQMASELWGDADGIMVKSHTFGKGIVLNGMKMQEALALIHCIPDCDLPKDNSIHYGHRTTDRAEVYFLTNQLDTSQVFYAEFRIKGMQPELWNPVNGKIRSLPAFTENEETTIVPLKLEPNESVFIVFRKNAGKTVAQDIKANFPDTELLTELTGSWSVQFDSKWRGPEKTVIFENLIDWGTSSDDRIKYYSGTAFYNKVFNLKNLSDDKSIVLDLGKVVAMAKVYVNDSYVGGLWTPPYKIDISDYVKAGENDLKIEVVNTWVNRIIGDLRLPEDERQTWYNVFHYSAESDLHPSGLLGPVCISTVKY